MIAFVLECQHRIGIAQVRFHSTVRQRTEHLRVNYRFGQTTVHCPQTQICLLRGIDRFANHRQRSFDPSPIPHIPSFHDLPSQEFKSAQWRPVPVSDNGVPYCNEFVAGQNRSQIKKNNDRRTHRQLKPAPSLRSAMSSHCHPFARHLSAEVEGDQLQMTILQSVWQRQSKQAGRRCASSDDSRNDHCRGSELQTLLHPRVIRPVRSRVLHQRPLISVNAFGDCPESRIVPQLMLADAALARLTGREKRWIATRLNLDFHENQAWWASARMASTKNHPVDRRYLSTGRMHMSR